MSGTARAQDVPARPDDRGQLNGNADAAQGERDIVVTGSRVITSGNSSPTPLTVVTADQLIDVQPYSILQGLNALPALTGGTTTTAGLGNGANVVNLRGIGPLRNLVLFDGQRVGPTQDQGTIAVDIVPQALLQRVEIVTGGASAVYGSDAVSGVINFITDRHFNGLRVDLRSGISHYGDDARKNASIAVGRDLFGGRGHFEASYEYRESDGFRRDDRPFFTPTVSETGTGTAASPYILTGNTRLSTSSFGGLIRSGPLAGLNFTTNGVLTPFVNGATTGTSGVQVGGDGSYYANVGVDAPQFVHQEFARFDFDVTDAIHFFAEGGAAQAHLYTIGNSYLISNAVIGYNNGYLSSVQPQYRTTIAAQLAANPLSTFTFSKMDLNFPNQLSVNQEDYFTVITGLDGRIGKLNWQLGYTRTETVNKPRTEVNVNNGRYLASLNAVVNPATGQIVCNAALVNPSVYGGCVPLNPFGPTASNQAAINYFLQEKSSQITFKTDDFSGVLRGAPFDLPAGPVGMALSGEYRRTTYEVKSDNLTGLANCTGIQFGCTGTTAAISGNAVGLRSPVGQSVWEGAYEINLPLLRDSAVARELSLNGAARYTHYSTSGGVATWKGGVDWKVIDDIRLRATRSRDIRAPNLVELFQATAINNNVTYTDPHTGVTGVTTSVNGGNPNLRPERADTITAGVVLTPRFLPGFSFSVDYYNIRIKDAIVGLNYNQAANVAACEASNGSGIACQLYVRPLPFSDRSAANFPTAVYVSSFNVGEFDTRGVDVEADYNTRLAGRRLGLRLLLNYQPKLHYDQGPGNVIDVAGAADGIGNLTGTPKWKGTASIDYEPADGFRIHAQERFRGKLTQNGSPLLAFADADIPGIAYTDLTVGYDVNKMFSLSMNVQNLFNQKPRDFAPAGGTTQIGSLGGYAPTDDVVGQYFTASLRIRM